MQPYQNHQYSENVRDKSIDAKINNLFTLKGNHGVSSLYTVFRSFILVKLIIIKCALS